MDDIVSPDQASKSARTSSHRSGRSAPIEIFTRNERRRWSLEQKHETVAESLSRGLTPTEVARKHAISSGQLYTWRRELLTMQTAIMTRSALRFAEVAMVAPLAQRVGDNLAPAEIKSPPSIFAQPGGLIEVVLPGGAVVRVDAQVDASALRRVFDALGGR